MDYINSSKLDKQALKQFKEKYILVYRFVKDNLINTDLYCSKSCVKLYIKTMQYADTIQYDDEIFYPDSSLAAIMIDAISETMDYNSKEYIVKAFQLANNNNCIRDLLNTLVELESSQTVKQILDKLQISLTHFLKNSNYNEIKEFIALYNNVKYNPENNLWFSDRRHAIKKNIEKGTKEDVNILFEYKMVELMEKQMVHKLIEYSKINRKDCIEFLRKIPQFVLSENFYGNSNYIRDVALPQILNVTGLDRSDIVVIECKHTPVEENGNCSLKRKDCRHTLNEIIRIIKTRNIKDNQKNINCELIIE